MSARTPDEERPDEIVETDDGAERIGDEEIGDDVDAEEGDPDADDYADEDDADEDADADEDWSDEEDAADEFDEGLPDDELEETLENEAELERDADDPADDVADIRTPLTEPDALVSRLRLIGEQPLAERAESLTQLHDELRSRLESGDPSPR